MPFSVKALLQRANRYNVPPPVIEEKVPEIKKEESPKYPDEPRQEIEIPVYIPEYDSEPEIISAPITRKRVKNENVVRKVNLNPLSDA